MTSASLARFAVLLVVAHAVPALGKEKDPTEHLNADRDALLMKIARGVEVEASTRRLAALVKQRDGWFPTLQVSKEAERRAQQLNEQYSKSFDAAVGSRCAFSPDPTHPLQSEHTEADWGRVVRTAVVSVPGRRSLDPAQHATYYEVKGLRATHIFRGEGFGPHDGVFEAKVGDLVLVCAKGTNTDEHLPPGWGTEAHRHGLAGKISRPPLVVEKARFNALTVDGYGLRKAAEAGTWPWPGRKVLVHTQLREGLGENRFTIWHGDEYVAVEAPPSLKNREHFVNWRTLWLVLDRPRYDKALGRLVLEIVDAEPAYVSQ